MAVSATVVSDFRALQVYYQRLNWIYRWFLPKTIRMQLDDLEHLYIHSDTLAGERLHLVCASVLQGGWYTQLMVYLFSGLYQFANTDFMKYAKRLNKINGLTQQNVQVLAEVEDIKATYDALVLLQGTGKTPLPEFISEVVAAISQISAIQVISDRRKKKVYKDLAGHKQPAKLTEAIQMVLAEKIYGVYDQLLAHCNPTFLVEALASLKAKGLLSADLLEMVSSLDDPRDFTTSVIALHEKNELDLMRLEVMRTSVNPKALADLMLAFATARKLDAETLGKLESHQININKIIAAKLSLDADQRLDLPYCDTLACGLERLHVAELSEGDIGACYGIFLQNIESSQRNVYAQILVLVFGTHGLGYSENFYEQKEAPVMEEVEAILKSLQAVPDAAALLKVLKAQKSLTRQEFNGFIAKQKLDRNPDVWKAPPVSKSIAYQNRSSENLEAAVVDTTVSLADAAGGKSSSRWLSEEVIEALHNVSKWVLPAEKETSLPTNVAGSDNFSCEA
ncbi:MAG: hypothetical protein NXI01_06485 [Gammaproteobacteria bacterium]|nr:hypothetical protein [Gammaproteobacteria bacterium]